MLQTTTLPVSIMSPTVPYILGIPVEVRMAIVRMVLEQWWDGIKDGEQRVLTIWDMMGISQMFRANITNYALLWAVIREDVCSSDNGEMASFHTRIKTHLKRSKDAKLDINITLNGECFMRVTVDCMADVARRRKMGMVTSETETRRGRGFIGSVVYRVVLFERALEVSNHPHAHDGRQLG
jgi:hypothetical protein